MLFHFVLSWNSRVRVICTQTKVSQISVDLFQMWKQMCYRTQHIHSLWLLHYGSVSHTDHYPCKILLCNHVIMNINADCVWTQLWNSSWWPRERLRAGGETSVYHVQTADVWQLASHLVFLLQRIHHTFPWVSLNMYFCLKWVSFTSICLCQNCMRCVQSMGISMYLFFFSLSLSFFFDSCTEI